MLILFAVLAAGCGNGPVDPTPPPPQLSCPAPISIGGVVGGVQSVTYGAPVATGGSAPVTTTCAPPSGSGFPIGTTSVSCTAIDALNRQAGCSFSVTLAALTLSVSRFLAFGDSVTAGEDGRALHVRPTFIDPVRSYPAVLQARLMDDFPEQSPTVVNAGRGGEFAADGVRRLRDLLQAQRPEALLLLEGYNDLLRSGRDAADTVVTALRDDVRNARASGVAHVFVSTLTPSRPATGPRNRAIDPGAIQETNARLAAMAAAENAYLVDAFAAFAGREAELVGDDGLHLTPAGNEVLAESFYERIRRAGLAAIRRAGP